MDLKNNIDRNHVLTQLLQIYKLSGTLQDIRRHLTANRQAREAGEQPMRPHDTYGTQFDIR